MIMKRIANLSLLALAAMLLPTGKAAAQDAMGTVTYALPRTVISLQVEAVKEYFYAGPYAKYASKYLGIEAAEEDRTTCTVRSVTMTPCIEADQDKRYYVTPGKASMDFLSLSSQGLIALADGHFGDGAAWRFAPPSGSDFSERGVDSGLTSESATLYRGAGEDAAGKVAVQQDMVVKKPLEQRAREAADMIFELRKKRVQIVTGDTDATYSGEAMGAALKEISALEKEYLSMFIGYSEFQTQTMKCDVVPEAGRKNQAYIAFRVSDTDGLVPADNVSGKPFILELVPQEISDAAGKGVAAKGNTAVYRIPSICTVKLLDGVNLLLQDRVAVYQLGREAYFPLSK